MCGDDGGRGVVEVVVLVPIDVPETEVLVLMPVVVVVVEEGEVVMIPVEPMGLVPLVIALRFIYNFLELATGKKMLGID